MTPVPAAPVVCNGLVLVALLGFPLVLFLARTFEVSPDGEILREEEAEAPELPIGAIRTGGGLSWEAVE